MDLGDLRVIDPRGEMPVSDKLLPQVPAKTPTPSKANPGAVTLKEGASRDLPTRHGDGDNGLVPASSASAIARGSDHQAASDTFKGMLNAALGCKTSETALALLGQVMALEHPTTKMEPERINTIRMNAIAMLAAHRFEIEKGRRCG